MRQVHGAPFASDDPDAQRVWWDEAVCTRTSRSGPARPISGQHCCIRRSTARRRDRKKRYGDIVVDTEKSSRSTGSGSHWRARPRPDNLRRRCGCPARSSRRLRVPPRIALAAGIAASGRASHSARQSRVPPRDTARARRQSRSAAARTPARALGATSRGAGDNRRAPRRDIAGAAARCRERLGATSTGASVPRGARRVGGVWGAISGPQQVVPYGDARGAPSPSRSRFAGRCADCARRWNGGRAPAAGAAARPAHAAPPRWRCRASTTGADHAGELRGAPCSLFWRCGDRTARGSCPRPSSSCP